MRVMEFFKQAESKEQFIELIMKLQESIAKKLSSQPVPPTAPPQPNNRQPTDQNTDHAKQFYEIIEHLRLRSHVLHVKSYINDMVSRRSSYKPEDLQKYDSIINRFKVIYDVLIGNIQNYQPTLMDLNTLKNIEAKVSQIAARTQQMNNQQPIQPNTQQQQQQQQPIQTTSTQPNNQPTQQNKPINNQPVQVQFNNQPTTFNNQQNIQHQNRNNALPSPAQSNSPAPTQPIQVDQPRPVENKVISYDVSPNFVEQFISALGKMVKDNPNELQSSIHRVDHMFTQNQECETFFSEFSTMNTNHSRAKPTKRKVEQLNVIQSDSIYPIATIIFKKRRTHEPSRMELDEMEKTFSQHLSSFSVQEVLITPTIHLTINNHDRSFLKMKCNIESKIMHVPSLIIHIDQSHENDPSKIVPSKINFESSEGDELNFIFVRARKLFYGDGQVHTMNVIPVMQSWMLCLKRSISNELKIDDMNKLN
ncbi:hypothetical protein AKO1_007326 [Acrasis kona]|uniref:Mediator complex subunit 15 n=1 Tax=Acrasis kona TaxID=1008807 RepID=A0AAW2YT40_9EUKA